MKVLVVGSIGRPHALRGEVRLRAFNPASPLWARGGSIDRELWLLPAGTIIEDADGAPVDVVDVSRPSPVGRWSVRPAGGDRLALALEGVADRTAAEGLGGRLVGVPIETLEAPGEDEFFFHDIPGWAVVTLGGEVVGHVVAAISTHIDILEVRPRGGGSTFYVPVIDDVVKQLDADGRRVVIDPIEGLLP